jgi:hypothetical protein
LRKKILDPIAEKNLMLFAAARPRPGPSSSEIAPGSSDSGAVRVAFVRVVLYATSMRSRGFHKKEKYREHTRNL